MQSGKLLAVTCWLPLASLVAVEIYASGFDGWGAWATAPLFLIPLVLAAVIGSAGVFRGMAELRAGRPNASTLCLTIVALLPVAWLLVRRHVI